MFKRKHTYVISEHPIRYFFDELWKARYGLWALGKRLALIGLVAWGGVKYLTHGGKHSLKEGLSNRLSEISDTKLMKDFREGLGMIKEAVRKPTPEEKAANDRWIETRHKAREDYRKLGINSFGIEHVDQKDPRWSQAVKGRQELMNHFKER